MTMRFKRHHRDKLRITYKAGGGGFQANALCDDGYFYQVYMRNDPAPKKYLKQGLSPLHYQTMDFFHSLKDDHHQVGMDNIYKSDTICRSDYHHGHKVLCHGMACKAGIGIPEYVFHDKEKNPFSRRATQGTVKASIL